MSYTYDMPILSLRLSPRELAEVRRRARAAGQNVSAYARGALVPEPPAPAGQPRLVRDRATGSLVLKSPPGAPKITPEQVREILADLP